MIERITGYKVGQQLFPTIEEAQKSELQNLFLQFGKLESATADLAAIATVENKDLVLDILTMTPDSRPRARKIHGGTKTRKSKAEAQDVKE